MGLNQKAQKLDVYLEARQRPIEAQDRSRTMGQFLGARDTLVLCLGKATRLAEYLVSGEKQYRAEAVFGISTDTQDGQGRVTRESATNDVTAQRVEQALSALEGEWDIEPPMVSAVRQDGKRLYELAREGKAVDRKRRRVQIRRCEPVDFDQGPPPRVLFDVVCSKGTYVRTLCSELGEHIGCGAYMSFLVRTRNGPWTLEQAATREQLDEARRERDIARHLLSLDAGLLDWPRVELTEEGATALQHGAQAPLPPGTQAVQAGQLIRVYDDLGGFLAVGRLVGPTGRSPTPSVAPVKVLKQGGETAKR